MFNFNEYSKAGLVLLARHPAPFRNGPTVGVKPACRSEGDMRVADESREIGSETWVRRLVGGGWKPLTILGGCHV